MRTYAVLATLALLSTVVNVGALPSEDFPGISPRMSSSLAAKLRAADNDPLAIIIQYDTFGARAAVNALGSPVAYDLHSIPAQFVWATPARILELARTPGVLYIEHNDRIEYDMDTAVVAGNVAPLWAPATPNVTIDGTKIDGKGVTVAVVDTGVNAAHEDIKFRQKTLRNLAAFALPPDPTRLNDPMSSTVLRFEEMENTDGGGHGSHVAGIVAGDGTLSGGKFRGTAPGASLVGLGSHYPYGTFWSAAAAWDWIFQNHKKVDPPIRIVTNSWGYELGKPCDLNISLTKIQKRLVLEAHIAMFFSAGNSGGDGTIDRGRTQYKCPWEGNIGVANYFDNDQGSRDWYQSNTSSRGHKEDVTTWPDISAPGHQIMSTRGEPPSAATGSYLVGCELMRTAQRAATGCYTVKSGTSMATPFAAGVGALVLQARPDLKPADLEYILEQTAHKFNRSYEDTPTPSHVDPAKDYRHHGSHYFKGHGLIDAEAAVRFALNYTAASSPVVYGENDAPSDSFGKPLGAVSGLQQGANGTPAAAFWMALAVLVGVTALRRRDSP